MPEGNNKCAYLKVIAYEYDSLNLVGPIFEYICAGLYYRPYSFISEPLRGCTFE